MPSSLGGSAGPALKLLSRRESWSLQWHLPTGVPAVTPGRETPRGGRHLLWHCIPSPEAGTRCCTSEEREVPQAGTQQAGQAEQTPRSPLLCPRPHLAIPGLVANTVWIVTRVGREFLPQRRAQAAARGGEGCEPEQRSWAPAGGKLAAHPHHAKRDTPTARRGTVALSPGLTDGRAAGGAAEMEVGLQGYVIFVQGVKFMF